MRVSTARVLHIPAAKAGVQTDLPQTAPIVISGPPRRRWNAIIKVELSASRTVHGSGMAQALKLAPSRKEKLYRMDTAELSG